MFFYYLVSLFSLGTVCGSSSSSSIPSSSSAAVRTRVLSLDTNKDATGTTVFSFKEHDLGANEIPPQNAICVRTPLGNVFYIDMGSGVHASKPNNLGGLPAQLQMKILRMSLNGFLSELGVYEVGVLRSARGVPYTHITDIEPVSSTRIAVQIDDSTRIGAPFNDKARHLVDGNGLERGILRDAQGRTYTDIAAEQYVVTGTKIVVNHYGTGRLFDMNGLEVGVLKNAQGVAYTDVDSIPYVTDTRIVVQLGDGTGRIFDVNGQETMLKNAQGATYTNLRNITVAAGGTRIAARLGDETVHLFDMNGLEVGVLKNAQGVLYSNIAFIEDVARGTRIVVWCNDRSRRLFDVNGQEIAFRNAQGVPYTHVRYINDVAGGTRLVVWNYNSPTLLFDVDGLEVGVLRNAQGVAYTDISNVCDVSGGTKIVAYHEDAERLFDVNGSEIALRTAQGIAYTNSTNIQTVARGTKIVALQGGATRLFDGNGLEVGALRNVQGVAYTNVSEIFAVADGTILVAKQRDGTCRLFDVDGLEVVLRNAQRVPYTNVSDVYNVADGTRIVGLMPGGSAAVFVFLSDDLQKNFGNLTVQKLVFLLAACKGLLQKGFDIRCRGNVSLKILHDMYNELSDDVRLILHTASYNIGVALSCGLCEINGAEAVGQAVYTCMNSHYLCAQCVMNIATTRLHDDFGSAQLRCPLCKDINITEIPARKRLRLSTTSPN